MTDALSHTLWPSAVELLHGVIQADADGGEAHLSVQSGHQSAVQTPRALRLHHSVDGTKHTSVPVLLDLQWGSAFTLDLKWHKCTRNIEFIHSCRSLMMSWRSAGCVWWSWSLSVYFSSLCVTSLVWQVLTPWVCLHITAAQCHLAACRKIKQAVLFTPLKAQRTCFVPEKTFVSTTEHKLHLVSFLRPHLGEAFIFLDCLTCSYGGLSQIQIK